MLAAALGGVLGNAQLVAGRNTASAAQPVSNGDHGDLRGMQQAPRHTEATKTRSTRPLPGVAGVGRDDLRRKSEALLMNRQMWMPATAMIAVLLGVASTGGCSTATESTGAAGTITDTAETADTRSDGNVDDTDGSLDAAADGSGADAAGLAPLPRAPAAAPHAGPFMGVLECAFCHTSGAGVLQDARGRDVSPTARWQASMMAQSARDPYWLAQLSHELDERPEHEDLILDVCTRCHAPVANELARRGSHSLELERLVAGTDPVDHLGREGVTCTVCHQITDTGLGSDESWVGGYVIGDAREIYGPHENPFENPMRNRVDYIPTAAPHIMESEMCATCHTVLTTPIGPDGHEVGDPFPEQVPYFEWLDSEAARTGTSCQDCHAPRTDLDGSPFTTVLSLRPPGLSTLREVGDHGFVGGNAYMLQLFADHVDETGTSAERGALLDAADRTETFLRSAATLELNRVGTDLVVRVQNRAGHKFPTAYPTRRAWLEVVATNAAGEVVFHSGAFDAQGYLLDGAGQRRTTAPVPHATHIATDDEVQIYEGVMAGTDGAPTHTLLSGAEWWKDNRILPLGWTGEHERSAMTRPVGTADDPDFIAGEDRVSYAIPADATEVRAMLWYQTVPPTSADALHARPTPASTTFRAMLARTPPVPRQVAAAGLAW